MISHGSVAICDAGPLIHLDELGCPQLLDEFTSYFRFFGNIGRRSAEGLG